MYYTKGDGSSDTSTIQTNCPLLVMTQHGVSATNVLESRTRLLPSTFFARRLQSGLLFALKTPQATRSVGDYWCVPDHQLIPVDGYWTRTRRRPPEPLASSQKTLPKLWGTVWFWTLNVLPLVED